MRDLKTLIDVPSEEQIKIHLQSAPAYIGYVVHKDGKTFITKSKEDKNKTKRNLIPLELREGSRLNGYSMFGYDILTKKSKDRIYDSRATGYKLACHAIRGRRGTILGD